MGHWPQGSATGAPNQSGGGPGGGGHGGGGGRGGGGFGGFGGPFGGGGGHGPWGMANTGRKYALTFSAQALNLLTILTTALPRARWLRLGTRQLESQGREAALKSRPVWPGTSLALGFGGTQNLLSGGVSVLETVVSD